MKKILVMPVKNEDWILGAALAAADLWADHIIVADQDSTDSSREICGRFEKVVLLQNSNTGLNQSAARQLLLDEARKRFGPENIIFALDADELLTANAINNEEFNNLLNSLKPGESLDLQWIMIWGSLKYYRQDNSVWGYSWKPFIFRDNGLAGFEQKTTSEPRMPEAFIGNSRRYEAVKVMHYQFVDWQRMLSKQRRYMVYDYLKKPSFFTALYLNRFYYPALSAPKDRSAKLKVLPDSWLEPYNNFLPKDLGDKQNYWFDADVKNIFDKNGTEKFKWLDIWDYNLGGNFADPRSWLQKFYHRRLNKYLAEINLPSRGIKKILMGS